MERMTEDDMKTIMAMANYASRMPDVYWERYLDFEKSQFSDGHFIHECQRMRYSEMQLAHAVMALGKEVARFDVARVKGPSTRRPESSVESSRLHGQGSRFYSWLKSLSRGTRSVPR